MDASNFYESFSFLDESFTLDEIHDLERISLHTASLLLSETQASRLDFDNKNCVTSKQARGTITDTKSFEAAPAKSLGLKVNDGDKENLVCVKPASVFNKVDFPKLVNRWTNSYWVRETRTLSVLQQRV